MKFWIQLLSGTVGMLAIGSIVILFLGDFPSMARVAYAGREIQAFYPGEAGFVIASLAVQGLAAFFSLYCITKRVGLIAQRCCIVGVVAAAILSLLDISLLSIMAVTLAALFVTYVLRHSSTGKTAENTL